MPVGSSSPVSVCQQVMKCPVRAAQLPVHAAKPTDAMTDRRDAEAGDDSADKLAPDPALIRRTQERRSRSCAEAPQRSHCENPGGVGAHTRRKGTDSVSETSEREACTLLDTPERKSEDLPWILRGGSRSGCECNGRKTSTVIVGRGSSSRSAPRKSITKSGTADRLGGRPQIFPNKLVRYRPA